MVAKRSSRPATSADLEALAPSVVGEILGGVLHATPRPALPHAAAASALGEELGPPFKRGRGGPGGWVILDEPELHLGRDVLVPDLAGWRRERLPEIPHAPFASIAPDWISEVLSESTEAIDRGDKLPVYARERVSHVWLVDPKARIRLDDLLDVALDTKTIRPVQEGDSAIPAMRFADSRVGPEVDKARLVLVTRARPTPLRLTDAYGAHMDATEWLGKIRVFLRKNGWVPEDERDPVSSG